MAVDCESDAVDCERDRGKNDRLTPPASGFAVEFLLQRTARISILPLPFSISTMNHNLDFGEYRLARAGRLLLVVWSVILLAGFALAARLEPDPRGFGTHQRLGLPPCTFQSMFNIPCPSCGMTTSFANVVRGRFGD